MITFDVRELSRNFLMPGADTQEVREHLVRMLLCGAVEIFNDPHLEQATIGDIEEVLENDYEVLGSEAIIRDMLKGIRAQAKASGWDPRTKAKIEYKILGKTFNRATVVMDLDETVARIVTAAQPTGDQDEHVTDIVSDNPGMDVINELNQRSARETRRHTPLLSDRSPAFVQEPEVRGWRVRDWDRFGRT